jgi:hypothetical protein
MKAGTTIEGFAFKQVVTFTLFVAFIRNGTVIHRLVFIDNFDLAVVVTKSNLTLAGGHSIHSYGPHFHRRIFEIPHFKLLVTSDRAGMRQE